MSSRAGALVPRRAAAVRAHPTQPACRVRKLSWHAGRLGRYGTVGHVRGDDPPPRRAKQCGSQTSHRVPRQVDSALTYGEYDLGHFCALVVRLRVKRG